MLKKFGGIIIRKVKRAPILGRAGLQRAHLPEKHHSHLPGLDMNIPSCVCSLELLRSFLRSHLGGKVVDAFHMGHLDRVKTPGVPKRFGRDQKLSWKQEAQGALEREKCGVSWGWAWKTPAP